MRAMRLFRLALVLCASVALAKKQDYAGEGADRMAAEIDANGDVEQPQSAEMAVHEAAATQGLNAQYKDALTDIMAVLLHGSEASKEAAVERMVGLAVATGEAGREQARMFRSAVVAGGALPALITTLSAEQGRRQWLAAAAIHALALDDPETDMDNFHQREICQAGAVPALVRLLEAEEPQLQSTVTQALATLAENPTCQAMIAAEGAIAPLLQMAHYGSDMQKLGALGALDVLSVNNPKVHAQLQKEGAPQVLTGLASMGSGMLRDEAQTFGARLAEGAPPSKMNAETHVKTARATRMRYDGVRQRAFQRMQGWQEG